MTHGQAGGSVMIVAGEASGDLHAARLVAAMRTARPNLRFCGMGGAELQAQGVELLYDAARLAVVGVFEVASHLVDILKARRALLDRLRRDPPALLVLIDFPDFNLWLAAGTRKLGIPIFYYISPQVWAWRAGRVAKIGRLADRIAVILPFEQAFYGERGVRVDYVGHPLVDTVRAEKSRAEFLQAQGIDPGKKIIGLLPGSRRREIATLLPVFLQAAARLRDSLGDCVFLLPLASTISMEQLRASGLETAGRGLDLRVVTSDRYSCMAACDGVVTASGTVTLELAILDVPMVVAYRMSPRTYALGRLLVRGIKYFSLVNLVAGREVVPELLQNEVTPQGLAGALGPLMGESTERRALLAGLFETRQRLGGGGASERAAAIALELVGAA